MMDEACLKQLAPPVLVRLADGMTVARHVLSVFDASTPFQRCGGM
jgi:hypothetical protein